MNDSTKYRLENIKKKELKLRAARQEILASESEKALDMILDAPSPAALVQSFPDQDLYYLLHKIGGDDFTPILALARSDQWEYVLDMETWDSDRLDIEGMTKTFDLLFQADPQRLLRWAITEKPEYMEFYLSKNIDIHVREHDEPPPEDFNDYITFDDKFYFRFPEKPKTDDDQMPVPGDSLPAWELIEKMLDLLTRMDLSVYHGLLLETKALLPAEVEEEQFRLKSTRLAEKGFMPAHEAIGIYQPTQLSSARKRQQELEKKQVVYDPELPMPPQCFEQIAPKDNLLIQTLKTFEPDISLELESELAALINKVISADKIKLRSKEDLEKAILKTGSQINLGLETILSESPTLQKAHDIINEYFLEDIFRAGSREAVRLTARAAGWFKNSYINEKDLPLSFLGEAFLGVIGGLFLERPLYFDNYESGELYRNFSSREDIRRTSTILDQVIAMDDFLAELAPDIKTFEQGLLTCKTLILTLWAKNRLGLDATLEPIPKNTFKTFFTALFPHAGKSNPDSPETENAIPLNDLILWASEISGIPDNKTPEPLKEFFTDLIKELEDEYGTVAPGHIDPRYISHFLLK